MLGLRAGLVVGTARHSRSEPMASSTFCTCSRPNSTRAEIGCRPQPRRGRGGLARSPVESRGRPSPGHGVVPMVITDWPVKATGGICHARGGASSLANIWVTTPAASQLTDEAATNPTRAHESRHSGSDTGTPCGSAAMCGRRRGPNPGFRALRRVRWRRIRPPDRLRCRSSTRAPPERANVVKEGSAAAGDSRFQPDLSQWLRSGLQRCRSVNSFRRYSTVAAGFRRRWCPEEWVAQTRRRSPCYPASTCPTPRKASPASRTFPNRSSSGGRGTTTAWALDHAPKAQDLTRFLKAFRRQVDARGLAVRGITTDGSSLYPGPPALVFAGVPHQVTLSGVERGVPRAHGDQP